MKMWLGLLLMLWYGGDRPTYWHEIETLHSMGCLVFNNYFISCPGVVPPPTAEDVPPDAVEVGDPPADAYPPEPAQDPTRPHIPWHR